MVAAPRPDGADWHVAFKQLHDKGVCRDRHRQQDDHWSPTARAMLKANGYAQLYIRPNEQNPPLAVLATGDIADEKGERVYLKRR